MDDALLTFEILAIAAILVVVYVVVTPHLAPLEAAYSWGPLAVAFFPAMLAILGVGFSAVLISVSSRSLTK